MENSKINKIMDETIKAFKDLGCKDANISKESRKDFINGKDKSICVAGLGNDKLNSNCSKVNKILKKYNAKVHPDNYGCAFLFIKESNVLGTDLTTILSATSYKNIYLTSDWHLFKNHYKKEKNKVNTSDIISWCKNNIKDNDVFMYLGDMCFRWANDEDKKKAQDIFKYLPGIKVLILGNHDIVAGEEFYKDCGFDFIFEDFTYGNFVFTHRPIKMDLYPSEFINIHGHMHELTDYNTTDGSRNINVYPYFYNNKPVTLEYLIKNKDRLIKNNVWNNNAMLGESVISIFNNVKLL